MQKQLEFEEVKLRIGSAIDAFPHEACETCECYLGYLAQLSMDTNAAGRALVAAHQVERAQIHACLGCDPCPPADLFAAYLKGENSCGCGNNSDCI
jgi:hypothetical protein